MTFGMETVETKRTSCLMLIARKFQVTNALRPIGDSESEIQALRNAIILVGWNARVDPRVILSVILQESTGNLRVGCTNNGVENCVSFVICTFNGIGIMLTLNDHRALCRATIPYKSPSIQATWFNQFIKW